MDGIRRSIVENLSAELIGAIVLFLTNTAGLVKVWTDNNKTKADRASTKAQRDQDSLDLHDKVQKNTWEIGNLKDTMKLYSDRLLDTERQINIIVKEMAVISTKLDNLIDLVKKESRDDRSAS
jgi:hypothetical protein